MPVNREDKRAFYNTVRRLPFKQFLEAMNVLHTRAYAAAERQYGEAMDIVLTPKQKAAVVSKANEIRELWDGMRTVTTDATTAELFRGEEESHGRDGGN
jgi:hypothetical protein